MTREKTERRVGMGRLPGASLAASLPGIAAIVVLAVAIYAPIAQAIVGYPSGEEGYRLLFAICHQYPRRSFWLLDHPMAICARCTGGYLGVALGTATTLLQHFDHLEKARRAILLSVCLVMFGVGDAFLKVLAGIDGPNVWRLFTGLSGGLGIGLFLVCFVLGRTDAAC